MTETEELALLFKSRYETACVPVARDKTPLVKWGKYRDRLPEDGEIRVWFSGNNSIAVVAGKVQCIDFDEKYSAGIFGKFKRRCAENAMGALVERLLCQRTPSGGYHLVFVCEPDERNSKLAVAENGNVAVETRASGGYFFNRAVGGLRNRIGKHREHSDNIARRARRAVFGCEIVRHPQSRKACLRNFRAPRRRLRFQSRRARIVAFLRLDARRRELLAQARQIAGNFRNVEPYPEQVFRVFEFD